MNNCCIRSSSANSLKTESFIKFLLISQLVQMLSSLKLVYFIELRSPSPELSHSNSIDDMATLKALNLLFISHRAVESNPLPFDRVLDFNGVENVIIKIRFGDQSSISKNWLIRLYIQANFTKVLSNKLTLQGRIVVRKIKGSSFLLDYQHSFEKRIERNFIRS